MLVGFFLLDYKPVRSPGLHLIFGVCPSTDRLGQCASETPEQKLEEITLRVGASQICNRGRALQPVTFGESGFTLTLFEGSAGTNLQAQTSALS